MAVTAAFPVIDPVATGKNILALRKEKGLSVKDLQAFFGFEEPQAIYRWQYGKTLPSVDNLYALSAILAVPMEQILVPRPDKSIILLEKQQEIPAASAFAEFFQQQLFIIHFLVSAITKIGANHPMTDIPYTNYRASICLCHLVGDGAV